MKTQKTHFLSRPGFIRNPIEEVSATIRTLKRKTYICKPEVE